jgi:hypothetical protein
MELIITQPANIAFRSLTEEDRRRVATLFDQLKNGEHDEHFRSQAHPLASDPSVNELRTSSNIVIFFGFEDEAIVILDLVRRQALESIRGAGLRAVHEDVH